MILAWLVLTATSASAATAADESSMVIVTNNSVTTETLDHNTARRMLSGKVAHWPNGMPVVVVLPPKASEPMHWLCAGLIHMPERIYRRFLLERAFRGAIEPIVAATTQFAARDSVLNTPGAISVVPYESVVEGLVVIDIQ